MTSRVVTAWQNRPPEVANLLNPAFCGVLLRQSVAEYEDRVGTGLPYGLVFLVLPIVLHRPTRDKIRLRMKQLHPWLQKYPEVKVDFADRARQLVPITREALAYSLKASAMYLDEEGQLHAVRVEDRMPAGEEMDEIADCFSKARVIGRWFARAGLPTTIYSMWGVKP